MKKSISLIAMLLPLQVLAVSPPSHCSVGAIFKGGVSVGGSQCGAADGCEDYNLSLGFDFLEVRSKNHLLLTGSNRIKGDGAPVFSSYEKVTFGDSIGGKKGIDESNLSGNAYFSYYAEYPIFLNGPGWVWVEKAAGESTTWCSKKEIYFQNAPTISKKSFDTSLSVSQPITASVNYTYDPYSYISIHGRPPTFTWTFDNKDLSGVIETKVTTVPYVSHSPQYSGDYRVTAIINDGTYSKAAILGLVDFRKQSGGGGSCNHNQDCENEL